MNVRISKGLKQTFVKHYGSLVEYIICKQKTGPQLASYHNIINTALAKQHCKLLRLGGELSWIDHDINKVD